MQRADGAERWATGQSSFRQPSKFQKSWDWQKKVTDHASYSHFANNSGLNKVLANSAKIIYVECMHGVHI